MVYYLFMTVWVGVSQIIPNSVFGTNISSYLLLFLMFSLMATVVFFRPITGDMEIYLRVFEYNGNLGWLEALSRVRWEPGFVTYQWLLAQLTTSKIVFIAISMLIMWALLIFTLKKIIAIKYFSIIMFGYLSFFYFYNFSMNVVRQGFAAPLLLLMLVYLGKNNYKRAILVFSIALTFHASSIMAGILLLIRRFNISVKYCCLIFVICSFLMITGLNEKLLSDIVLVFGGELGTSVTSYVSEDKISRYGSVNRIDFLVFTSVWILWGLWFRKIYLIHDTFYDWLLKSYIALSSVYVLFGFIAYSDRLAAYAWFLIPLLLFYPTLKMKLKYRNFWLLICMITSIALFFYFNVSLLFEPLKLIY